jgi:tellurite methyltransferase
MFFLVLITFLLQIDCVWSSKNFPTRAPVGPERYEFLTGKLSVGNDLKSRWDRFYGKSQFMYGKKPAKFLAANYHVIPPHGKVLDIGMGEGRNGVFLATKGRQVTGIDISEVAVKKAELLAKEYGTKIKSIVADVEKYDFPPHSFDAIISFYYVDRKLLSRLMKWLKPGGYIFYEAHLIDYKRRLKSKEPDQYFLKKRELLEFFPKFKVLKYSESASDQDMASSIVVKKTL